MKLSNFQEFKERLLQEIIDELNRRQGIPMSIHKVNLETKAENHFEGTLLCGETHHSWEIPLEVKIEGNKIHWNANEKEWYSFDY